MFYFALCRFFVGALACILALRHHPIGAAFCSAPLTLFAAIRRPPIAARRLLPPAASPRSKSAQALFSCKSYKAVQERREKACYRARGVREVGQPALRREHGNLTGTNGGTGAGRDSRYISREVSLVASFLSWFRQINSK
eukprot:scaffold8023_cov103-Isochrysis_galbana.AAC.24